jgi:hypothetical protein
MINKVNLFKSNNMIIYFNLHKLITETNINITDLRYFSILAHNPIGGIKALFNRSEVRDEQIL